MEATSIQMREILQVQRVSLQTAVRAGTNDIVEEIPQ